MRRSERVPDLHPGSTMHAESSAHAANAERDAQDSELAGTLGNYEIVRAIGRGGMGAVYEAKDLSRGRTVALKTMRTPDSEDASDLKREFRIVSELAHENLVRRFELGNGRAKDGDAHTWFFTMEYVEGCSVVEYARHAGKPDYERIQSALGQLAFGLGALHNAGLMHQDIKPSNVLVDQNGRLVLLDFGLASLAGQERDEWGRAVSAWGTAGYLAPEKSLGGVITPASDWFSVGVMLYQMLTGELPPRQSAGRLKLLTAEIDHERLSFPDDCPEELSDLCARLLASRPEERAGDTDVREVLGLGDDLEEQGPFSGPRSGGRQPFVGRRAQLDVLRSAHALTTAGEAAVVHVRGKSGMGKTALVRRFLSTLDSPWAPVILEGRCLERESVPYKAFDHLTDALARFLITLDPQRVEPLVPPDAHLLLRIFPVLRRVPALQQAEQPAGLTISVHELRRRAFRALKTLLLRMTESRQVILVIDDLQWGDVDSAHLLMELVAAPAPPCLLVVLSYRSDEVASSECLREYLLHHDDRAVRSFEVDVGTLNSDEAKTLALELSGNSGAESAAVIAREAAGSPFLLQVLSRYAALSQSSVKGVTLTAVLAEELTHLSSDARRLLEVVAIAGRPLALPTALEAAKPEGDPHTMLDQLRERHLVRSSGGMRPSAVEVYHDAIRTTVVALVDEATQERCHRDLAAALEASESADPEALARHHRGAGNLEAARRYATIAGDHAVDTLAFGHAADLFALARACTTSVDLPLALKQAHALDMAGRCGEAADLYTWCADQQTRESWDHRRRAAEHYLVSGRLERGIEAMRPVLEHVGLTYPTAPWIAMAGLAKDLAVLSVRGHKFASRSIDDIPEAQMAKLRTCFSAGKGLAPCDPLRAVFYIVRGTLIALRVGDAAHVARGLSFVGMAYVSDGGARSIKKGMKLIDEGERVAREHGHDAALGWVATARGIAVTSIGDWRASIDEFDEGVALMRAKTVGTHWEQTHSLATSLLSLASLGELERMSVRANRLRREAAEVGDVIMTVEGSLYAALADLAADQPRVARQRLDDTMTRWTTEGYHYQHWTALRYRTYCDLYDQRLVDTMRNLDDNIRQAKEARLFDNQIVRGEAPMLRAYTALACIDAGDGPARWVPVVEKARRELHKLERTWADAAALALQAGLARAQGDVSGAVASLRQAREAYHRADMALHAAVMKRRLGETLGGERGESLARDADDAMRARGVQAPARWARVYAPGFKRRAR